MSLLDLQENAVVLLNDALVGDKFGRTAVVSSFGAESAALLHLVSRVNKNATVLFIDTRMLFQETLAYKTELVRHLGLTNVSTISPDFATIRAKDIWGRMHTTDADKCCDFRKTSVLDAALESFDGWITGRKRFQAVSRSFLKTVETTIDNKSKINPLADWDKQDIADYLEWFDLPQHPLTKLGYASIGCATCTSPVSKGEDARSGRWRGMNKIECGIHLETKSSVQESKKNV